MEKTKVCIIGCGNIGTYHLGHFLKMDDVQVVGVCDLIKERRDAFAEKAGCPAFGSYLDMYDAVNPDCVFICIPPYAHGEIEFETIRRNIPMFVEKPVGLDPKTFLAIRDAIDEKGLITASGLQLRYENNMDVLKEFAAKYPIVEANLMRVGGFVSTPWFKTRILGGGQLVEQTVHQVDMMRNIMGVEPVEVFSFGRKQYLNDVPGCDIEDASVSVVRFENGAIATITTGLYAEKAEAADNKLTFGALDARADYYMFDKVVVYGEMEETREEGMAEVVSGDGRMASKATGKVYKYEGDAGMLCDHTFIEAVQTGDGSKIRSPYRDAVKSVLFTLACNESMDTGKAVKVNAYL